MDGDVESLFQCADELLRHVRRQQARHVLDGQHVGAGFDEPLGEVNEVLQRVDRADGVGQRGFQGLPGTLHRVHGRLHVADVVHGVEHPEDVDAVLRGLFDEGLDGVVRVVVVSHDVLAPQQHLQPGIGHGLPDQPQALPGVFVQVPEARVERGAAPHLDRPEADLVEILGDGQHVLGAHARRQQRLVCVPEHGFSYPDSLAFHQFLPICEW